MQRLAKRRQSPRMHLPSRRLRSLHSPCSTYHNARSLVRFTCLYISKPLSPEQFGHPEGRVPLGGSWNFTCSKFTPLPSFTRFWRTARCIQIGSAKCIAGTSVEPFHPSISWSAPWGWSTITLELLHLSLSHTRNYCPDMHQTYAPHIQEPRYVGTQRQAMPMLQGSAGTCQLHWQAHLAHKTGAWT